MIKSKIDIYLNEKEPLSNSQSAETTSKAEISQAIRETLADTIKKIVLKRYRTILSDLYINPE